MRDVGVPSTLDAVLDRAWLSSALEIEDGERILDAEVVDSSQTLAQKVRFRVTTQRADGTTSTLALCVKAHLDGSPGTDLIAEAHFYRELAPRLDVRVPRPYYAAVDGASQQAMIVMDDVVAAGGRFLSAHEPYSPDTATDSLGQLARLHAATWGTGAAEHGDWLVPRIMNLTAFFPPEVLQPLLDDGRAPDVAPALRDAELVTEAARRTCAREPTCVLHGDPHSGNSYLDARGQACWLDWQVVQQGHWSTDIAYHLATVLDVETRRTHERDLLGHYLRELELAGGPALPRNDAWEQYTLGFAYGYFLWAITRISSRAVVLIHIPRLAAALTDHDTFRRLGVA